MKLIAVALVFLLAILPIVSAQTLPPVGDVVQSFLDAFKEILTPVFEVFLNTSSYDDFFFAKILMLLLIFIVILTVMKRIELFKDNKGVSFIVALVVSVLAVRYMPQEFVGGALLPYGALGIAITTFLPFLIYFWFVHQSVPGGFGRRMAWILYGIVFLLVWGTRPSGEISGASNWIYFLGFVAVLASMFFDKTLHGYFKLSEISKFKRGADRRLIASLQEEYARLSNSGANTREVNERKEDIVKQLKKMGANPYY